MKRSDIFLVILMCLFWGTDYVITKIALEHFSPIFFSSLRFFIVALFTLPFCRRRPPFFKTLFIVSFILVVLAYGFGDIGIKMNSSIGVSNIIIQSNVIVGIIAACIFLKEKLTIRHIIGIIVAFSGMIIVVIGNTVLGVESNGSFILDRKNLISIGFLLMTVFAWPIYTIVSKKLEEKIDAKEIIAWTAIIGAIQGLLVSLIFETGQIKSLITMDWQLSFYVLYAGTAGILVPHLVWHHLIHRYDVSKVTSFSLLIPIITAIEGVVLLGETLNHTIIIGSVVVLYGLYLTNFSKKKNISL